VWTNDCQFHFTGPVETVGLACATNTDCYFNRDRDGDTVTDNLDNCVLTPNTPQTNLDGDTRGDACDPDCTLTTTLRRCTANASTTADCVTNGDQYTVNRTWTIEHTGVCSNVDDDADADRNEDAIDDCPTVSNPAIIAGTQRQKDSDRDGLGDACDPAGTFDDEGDGIPDDVVTFNGSVQCRTLPLANFSVISVQYQDYNGDIDAFPDTGESGRIVATIVNNGIDLTDVTIVLTSQDDDVACITRPSLFVGDIDNGEQVTFGNFTPGGAGLEFVAANAPTLEFTGLGDDPEQASLCFGVIANEIQGTAQPICFNLLADLNAPPGVTQVFTNGADGVANTSDDGVITENFDLDKDADGNHTINDTFLERNTPGTYRGTCSTAPQTFCETSADCPLSGGGDPGICYRGSYIRGTDAGQPPIGTVAAVTCGGYNDALQNPGGCILDPDFPFDWHFHCPIGATNCPNVETGTCVGGCAYETPTGGTKSHSTPNSLHMGAHFDDQDNLAGDSTHFRTLQGFQSAPMNMALFPRPGDLQMSFFHIARLMDNNGVGPNNKNQCVDCADVQIQLDNDPDPDIDNWGFWDKLVPFENVYDHRNQAWSVFGGYYCQFTPTDTGTAPPNPRGIHETLCYPLGAWSHCGSTIGTVPTATVNCPGPGEVDPSGTGVWVRSSFNLAGYLGQRVRIRWIAETWNFANNESSYFEIGDGWDTTQQDDGWWLDDINVVGTVTAQVTPAADTTARVGTCPSDPCNELVGDKGTNVQLQITDLQGNVIDGINNIQYAGQSIRVSAINSTMPGGCVGGTAEFEFSRVDAVVGQDQIVQAFGPKTYFQDAPETNATYFVRMRCSTDTTGPTACVSAVGATIDAGPYLGAGGDAFFGERSSPATNVRGVQYFRGVCIAPSVAPFLGQPCNSSTTGAGMDACGAGGNCGIGVCTAGTIGASCNVAANCGGGGVCDPVATGNDTTSLRWWGPGNNYGTDLLRGRVPVGSCTAGAVGIGTACQTNADCGAGGACNANTSLPLKAAARSGVFWDLNTRVCTAGAVGLPCNVASDCGAGGVCTTASCFQSNVAGSPVVGGPGTNYFSNLLSQVSDPNPGLNHGIFYDIATNSSVGGNLNALGCAGPAICNNPGWCELGTSAGAPCSVDADCAGGGYCGTNRCTAGTSGGFSTAGKGCNTDAHCGLGGVCGPTAAAADPVVPTFCKSDSGMGNLGGCGRIPVCSGGAHNLRICDPTAAAATTCPGAGASCPAVTGAALTTAGQLCFNLSDVNLPPPFGSCPVSGHAKKLTRHIGGAGLVCP
jgi:hypothetical protein